MAKRAISCLICGVVLSACEQGVPPTSPEPQAAASAPAEEPAPAQSTRTPAPEGAEVYFIAPSDGASVSAPFSVQFGLRGAGVAPAGIDLPNTGHHHLLIDTELTNFDSPVPADDRHLHFGIGQTETTLMLPPGQHRLQLVFADHLHIPHDPPVLSDVITVEVTE